MKKIAIFGVGAQGSTIARRMDLVLKLCPPAPKYPDEIKAIIDEGLFVPEEFDADARRYCFEELA